LAKAELEWITRGRECRQQLAWFGTLAKAPGGRRATVVNDAGDCHSLVGEPQEVGQIADEPARFVCEPDPSVIAAELLGAFAGKHALASLGPGAVYLTGDSLMHDPLAACFEVLDCMPLDSTKLAKYFAERSVGQLEIKKRGVAINPDVLRRKLKLRGPNAATLLVTRIGRREAAIVAERVPS
jgi:hypothetical protein